MSASHSWVGPCGDLRALRPLVLHLRRAVGGEVVRHLAAMEGRVSVLGCRPHPVFTAGPMPAWVGSHVTRSLMKDPLLQQRSLAEFVACLKDVRQRSLPAGAPVFHAIVHRLVQQTLEERSHIFLNVCRRFGSFWGAGWLLLLSYSCSSNIL